MKIKAKGLCNKHYLRLSRNGNPLIKKKKWKEPIRFKISSSNCYEVTSHKVGSHGYPQVQHKRQTTPAHRKIYEECFGEIPHNLVVRHKCDNRLCVNPEHLEIGTYKDNNHDAIKRGRNAFGERNSQAKLSDSKVREIKSVFYQSEVDKSLMNELSRKYNVHINTLYDIYYNKTWKHVEL